MRLMSVLMVMAIVMFCIFLVTQEGITGGGHKNNSKEGTHLTSRDWSRNAFEKIMDDSRRPGIDLSSDKAANGVKCRDALPSRDAEDLTDGHAGCFGDDHFCVRGIKQAVPRSEFTRRLDENRAPLFGLPIDYPTKSSHQDPDPWYQLH